MQSGMSKHRGDLDLIREMVRTKSLQEIVCFFYVENGYRKKKLRDKRREIEELRFRSKQKMMTGQSVMSDKVSSEQPEASGERERDEQDH